MESKLIPTRAFVNGSYLMKYIDKPVTLIGSVVKVGDDEKSLTLQTTDDQIVTVNFHEAIDSSLDGWIEVHGFAKDKSTVSGENYYNLPSSIIVDFGPYHAPRSPRVNAADNNTPEKQQFNETIRLIYTLANPLK